MKHQIGAGCSLPCTFEPSQSKKVGQKTIMMRGVPLLTKKRKLEDKTVIILAMIAVLFLNQRFRRRTKSSPRTLPTKILGSLIV